MLIATDKLKDVCNQISNAVDASGLSLITETLELKTEGNVLCANVTNQEYYTQMRLSLEEPCEFHATVNAELFLKLIKKITTDTINMDVEKNNLKVKGNGTYRIPLIFAGDKLLELPKIEITEVVSTFNISKDILTSIASYNSKEISKGNFSRPVQQMYYIDEMGCITFTTGACVNNFTLPCPVKTLFTNRLVKLFKLFKSDTITLTLGTETINGLKFTKVKFDAPEITVTGVINTDGDIVNSVPSNAIRGVANKAYPYKVELDKSSLIETIDRLLLFTPTKGVVKPFSIFEFGPKSVVIWDREKSNFEELPYMNEDANIESYSAVLDLNDLRFTSENADGKLILHFGDGAAFVAKRDNIYNVIPECMMN